MDSSSNEMYNSSQNETSDEAMHSMEVDSVDEASEQDDSAEDDSVGADSMETDVDSASKGPLFQPITAEEILELMNEQIADVAMVVQIPTTIIRILLVHTKWDKQELLDRLTDENNDAFFEAAHVENPFKPTSVVKRRATRNKVTCSICYCEYQRDELYGLSCNHDYCKFCWNQYLTTRIQDDGDADAISCPSSKCAMIVDDVTVMELVEDEGTKQKYHHIITNSFVKQDHCLCWCPAPGCIFAIKVDRLLEYRQDCTCKCGHSFCFNCLSNKHDPIPCSMMTRWRSQGSDETIEYITKFTKRCPKCTSLIAKDGGCNHMTCKSCKHEFCWLCFNNWKDHNNCNTYKNEDVTDVKKKLLRWDHHFKRYNVHKTSADLERSLPAKIQKFIRDREEEKFHISDSDIKVLREAIDVLAESRRQIMLTYIFAYGVKQNMQTDIFETNQGDLEQATENLSKNLEEELLLDCDVELGEILAITQNRSEYCRKRQGALQEHIFEGFEKNWWEFEVEVATLNK